MSSGFRIVLAARLLRLARSCLVIGACSSCSSVPSDRDAPSYARDVAPLLARSCVGCHQQGGIAPFALISYEEARHHASEIARATAAREMPPMPVDNSGSCNTYSNARWLKDPEIDLLARWAKAGAPEGDHSSSPPPPVTPPTLADPDAVVDMGVAYTPSDADGHDDYRCFMVPAPVSEARYLTGFEVQPGESRIVHHVIVYQPLDAADADSARALDDAAPGPGYPCFGDPGVKAAPLLMWAPGAGAIQLPAGTGVPLAGRRDLIVQIHYNLENGAAPDRTRVALKLAHEPVISAEYLPAFDLDLRLPPGKASVSAMGSVPIDGKKLTVYGAMPHMHTLGRTLRVDVEDSGSSRCLVDVDRWDFHWQNAWWYDQPLVIDDASSLSIRCSYDTRGKRDVVTWGENTSDEMCLSFFYVTTRDEPDPTLSCEDAQNPLFGSCVDDLLAGCFEPDLAGTCRNQDGQLSWSDGSQVVSSGPSAGLYAGGDADACIGIVYDGPTITLSRGELLLRYSASGDGATFECPDGSRLQASSFQVNEYNRCRGLTCPD